MPGTNGSGRAPGGRQAPLGPVRSRGAGVREDLFVVIARRLVYVGMVFLPLLKFRFGHAFDLSDGIFLIAAGFLILSRRPPKKAPPVPGWYFGSFVFILAGVVASSQAVSKGSSLEVVLNAIFVFFVLQWMLRQLLDTTERIQLAMGAFIVGTTASAFVAFLQTEFHVLGYGQVANLEGARAIGLSDQPNVAAVAFALAMVFAIGLVLELGLRRHWYLGLCIAVLGSALIFSASVSGQTSTLVGCIVLFIARGIRLRTVLTLIAALAVVYVIAITVQSNGTHFDLDPLARIEQTTTANSGYNTVSSREDTIRDSWSGIVESPIIGHGLDQTTIAVYYDPYLGVYYPAHNIVIIYWFAGGIFMVAAVALMMASAFRRVLVRRDAPRGTVLAGCVTVLFFSLQSPELVDRWLWLPFMLALCFRVPARRRPGAPDLVPAPPSTDTETSPSARPARFVRGTVGRHARPVTDESGPTGKPSSS